MTVSGASNLSMMTRCRLRASAWFWASDFSFLSASSSSSSPGEIFTWSPRSRTSETCRGCCIRSRSDPRISNSAMEMSGGTSVRPFWRITTPRPADRDARKDTPFERFDGHFALELVGEERDHARLQRFRSDRDREQRGDDDNGCKIPRAASSTHIRVRRVSFLYTLAMRLTLKQGASHRALTLELAGSYFGLGEKAAVIGERLVDSHAGHSTQSVKGFNRGREHHHLVRLLKFHT